MANYNAITDEKIKEIQELRDAGFTNKEIAKEMGISGATVSRYAPKFKVKKRAAPISENTFQKMLELRTKGLSNSQIGKELGMSYSTVLRKLGPQPDMVRAEYGSIISHVTGETFVKEEEPKMQKKTALKLIKTCVEMQGREFTYKATTEGEVRITHPTGFATNLTADQFYNYIAELCEVGDWLTENASSHHKQTAL